MADKETDMVTRIQKQEGADAIMDKGFVTERDIPSGNKTLILKQLEASFTEKRAQSKRLYRPYALLLLIEWQLLSLLH